VTGFADVPDYLLDEAQRAARELLVHGLVTPRYPDAATFARVRKWGASIAAELERLAGFVVHDTRAGVRLERKRDALDAWTWWPDEERAPDARVLSLTCLVLAALERADDQLLLSDLASAVSLAAGRAGVRFDADVHADRRALCHAVTALDRLGVLVVRDGRVDAWRDHAGMGEALLDVDRDVLRLLFIPARPLHAVTSAHELLPIEAPSGSRDVVRQRRRQRIVRALLDRPVVYYADLDEAERTYLRLEAASVAADVERLTGGVLERRAEGVALVIAYGGAGVETFPSTDGETVAALALVNDLLRAENAPATSVARPSFAPPAPVRSGATRPVPEVAERVAMVPDEILLRAARTHVGRLGDAVRQDLREPEAFLRAGVERLAAFDLVRLVPGGVCPMPALARFRDAALRVAPSRER
jgi:uncharacterized protein (TIGR02678 family)